MTTRRHLILTLGLTAYAGTVLLANVLVTELGTVPVGFGLVAPAAVLAVGLSLVVRDVLHDLAGHLWPVYIGAGIAAGALLSAAVAAPRLALASAAAFALGEVLDALIYVPLRRRGFTIAALASSAAGLVVDSIVFLELAPRIVPGVDNLDLLRGQIVGKLEVVLAVVALVELARQAARTSE